MSSSEFRFNLLGHNVSESDITEWLQADDTDHGYAYLSDDEIVTAVVEESEEESDNDEDETNKAIMMFDRCLK